MSVSVIQAAKLTQEGVPYLVANMFPPGVLAQHVGVGDDVPNGIKYGGSRFYMSSVAVEQKTFTWQYLETIWMGGGQLTSAGQTVADWVSMRVYAPATTGTNNPGAGAYNKYSIGGGVSLFVPASGATGNWDLNLSEKHNANVGFTKVVPVPASNNGWFDYDYETQVCTLNALQAGGYHLIDAEVTLGRPVVKVALCQLQLTVPEVVAKPMLPQWKYEVVMDHGSTDQLDVCWVMFIGRRSIS